MTEEIKFTYPLLLCVQEMVADALGHPRSTGCEHSAKLTLQFAFPTSFLGLVHARGGEGAYLLRVATKQTFCEADLPFASSGIGKQENHKSMKFMSVYLSAISYPVLLPWRVSHKASSYERQLFR